MRIEAEVVDGVVTRQPLAEESGYCGDTLSQFVERDLGGRRTRWAAVIIYLADDGGDLFGGRPTIRVGKEGRMLAR